MTYVNWTLKRQYVAVLRRGPWLRQARALLLTNRRPQDRLFVYPLTASLSPSVKLDVHTHLPPRAIMKLNEIILIHEPESELYLHIANTP